MFHKNNRQCSILATVPRKLMGEAHLLNGYFNRKVFLLFADDATTFVLPYKFPYARCKFTVTFKHRIEDENYCESLLKRLIKLTLTEVEAAYDKKEAIRLQEEIINDYRSQEKNHRLW